MPTILLHSSKTMRHSPSIRDNYQAPQLLERAEVLAAFVQSLSVPEIKRTMKLSDPMAVKTCKLLSQWTAEPSTHTPAIDAFLGDIYSGLQVQTFNTTDRAYANNHLFILSGLYGVLRALDSISPYRLEMGYRFSKKPFTDLYDYWGEAIAACIPTDQPIINVSSDEYTKAVLPYLPEATVIAPRFLTRDPSSNEPKFVVVHAKIARGAFARWLIQQRVADMNQLKDFSDLGYRYDASLSSPEQPVFVCDGFQGLGLSVRLT